MSKKMENVLQSVLFMFLTIVPTFLGIGVAGNEYHMTIIL